MSQVRKNDPLSILYLGYLGRAKGTFDLVEAAKEVLSKGIDASFDLVGEELTPGEYEQLRERIDAAALNGCVRLHSPAYGPENSHSYVS
jgi:glycosyltransferase involved in cell wall biosynthesis